MSEQEIRANDLVQYVGPDPDMYATYGRVHTVHTFGLSGPVADTLFDGQTGMDAVPVKFLHKVPANTAPDAPQDHGPLAAPLSDRTLAKVLSRPAYVPSLVALDAIEEVLSAIPDLLGEHWNWSYPHGVPTCMCGTALEGIQAGQAVYPALHRHQRDLIASAYRSAVQS